MGENDRILIRYAVGKSTNFAKAENRTGIWSELCERLSSPVKTSETRAEFDLLSRDDQDLLKSVDGWLSGAQCEGKWRNLKNVKPRNLLTLDLDYAEQSLPDQILAGTTALSRFECFTHSSRRHTKRKPRLRQLYPLSRKVSADEYTSLVRIVSWILDGKREPIIQVDKVSARVAQMMFFPTMSSDGQWFSHRQEGKLLNPDEIFDLYRKKRGDPFDLSSLPLFDTEGQIRKSEERAENPLEKPGVIGAFCRAYDVEDAMATFLEGVYLPGDEHSGKPRYTYAGSTSSNGAIVEDDGLFLYSFHGHDPCCEQNVNAFDLVRIHKFGNLDERAEKDTPVPQLPSQKAMLEFAKADEKVRYEIVQDQYSIIRQFENESDDDEPEEEDDDAEEDNLLQDAAPRPKKKEKTKGKTDWRTDLETDRQGNNLPTINNYNLILQNDKRLKNAVRYNEFTNQINLCRSIISRIDLIPDKICRDPINGDLMADEDDSTLRGIFDSPKNKGGYGMSNHIGNLRDSVILSARNSPFHPVKTYIESIKWDGISRIDDFLIRYLKVDKNIYTREVSRLMLLASVTRIYEPGHKFDFMAVLEGKQGIRKSTFIKVLYRDKWFGELDCKLDDKKEFMEQAPGKWGLESAELDSLKKSDSPVIKKFLRKTELITRMAYGHRATVFLIQSVCWGSTNETKYLRDPSGNRSFFPLLCKLSKGEHIDTDYLIKERDQLWAEAFVEYKRMRQKTPQGTLPLFLGEEAEDIANVLRKAARQHEIHEELADQMIELADTPIMLSELLREYIGSASGFQDEKELDPETTLVLRCIITRRDLIRAAFGDRVEQLTDQVRKTNFDKAEDIFLRGWEQPIGSRRKFGQKVGGRWYTRKGATEKESAEGYRVLPQEGVKPDDDDLLG